MEVQFFIYILSNESNNVLYIGVTNDLKRRVDEHKSKINKGFTNKYNVSKLVHFEVFPRITLAIEREKLLKKWKREWKENLINEQNPEWKDLFDDL